jgi:hypothetical protein
MYPVDAAKGVFNDIQHTIPDTPVFTSVVAGDASVTLRWTVPASNESPLISYTITAYDASNNITTKIVTSVAASTGSTTLPNTFKFTGLVNGISYRFTIYATNDIGNSYASAFTNAVIPTKVPEQPTAFVVFQENNYFTTQWLVPLNGGSAITSYVLTLCDASNNILRDVSNNILRDASNNILRDASNNILRDLSNNIIQNIIRDDNVLNTRQGLLIVTNTAGVQVPYTIGNPIASNLVIGNYYSFKLLARNAAGDSLITTLAAPVRFIKIPAQAPLWVAGSDVVYNPLEDRLTFKFTQTADDRNMTTSYTFSSIPVAIERSLTIQNTTTTNLGGVIQVVASIVGIPDNTYTFTVYAYNVATRVADYRISLNSSPIIVSNI